MVNTYIRCEDISHFTLFEFTSKIEKNEKCGLFLNFEQL